MKKQDNGLLYAGLGVALAGIAYMLFKNAQPGGVVKNVTAQSPDWATAAAAGGGSIPAVGRGSYFSEPMPVVRAAELEPIAQVMPVVRTMYTPAEAAQVPASGGSTGTQQTATKVYVAPVNPPSQPYSPESSSIPQTTKLNIREK